MQATKLNVRQFVNVCLALTRRCADIIRDVHESGDLKKQMKGHNDPVTEADLKSQFVIQRGLFKRWPTLTFVGEESESNLVATDFDFDAIDANVQMPELDFLDEDFDVADLAVYVDPLDGTMAFTKGRLESVTTLIGLAHKGKPLVGLIGQIWAKADRSFRPLVYVGMTGHQRLVSIFTDHVNQYRLRHVQTGFEQPATEDRVWRIACSVHYFDPKTEQFLAALGKVEKTQVSGIGFKFIACIEGTIDGHIQTTTNHSRWDILPGHAIFEALGGRCTGLHGDDYSYDGNRENAQNMDGLFFLTSAAKHAEVMPRFSEILAEKSSE